MYAGTIAAGFALSQAAHSQIPVTDLGNLQQQFQHTLNELRSIAQGAQQISQQAQQIMWAKNTFDSFVHNPSLGTAMGALNATGIKNPLQFNPYDVQAAISGQGGVTGTLGSISSLANSAYSANHVYTPKDGSWESQQVIARGYAGAQGIAAQLYQTISDHFPVMEALRARLATATTPKDVADIQAQIGTEQAFVDSAKTQLASTQFMFQAQQAANDQREREHFKQDLDEAIAEAKEHAGW